MSDDQSQVKPEGNEKPPKFKVQHTWSLRLAYLIAIGLLSLLFIDPNKFLPQPDPLKGSIAIVLAKSNDVKRKHPRAASWTSVKKDDKLYPNSMLFTGKDSYVKIALIDASIINQGPESLLRLRMAKKRKKKKKKKKVDLKSNSPGSSDGVTTGDGSGSSASAGQDSLDDSLEDDGEYEEGSGIALELDGGNIDIEASEESSIKSIATRDTKIEVSGGTSLNLKNAEGGGSSEIAVKKGTAKVKTKTTPSKAVSVTKGQKINTEKLREEEEKADQEVVEKIKAESSGGSNSFGDTGNVQRKGIVEILKEIGKIILFLD
ncbi:MAG: hypothetical protein KC493_09375 [Bacteriovoracaceae bacterium]|nr:hypothetical protein [Bacteriovoracaceae bacterium]